MGTVVVEHFEMTAHQVHWRLRITRPEADPVLFSLTRWCEDDLRQLSTKIGDVFLNRIWLHVFGYESIRHLTFGDVRSIDFGPLAPFVDDQFVAHWRNSVSTVLCSQWCYENGVDSYTPPVVTNPPVPNFTPGVLEANVDPAKRFISLFGGGKDTLLCCRLLEAAGVQYGCFHESNTAYGSAKKQHLVIDQMSRAMKLKGMVHNVWVNDDFYDSPVSHLFGNGGKAHMGWRGTGSEVHGSPGSASVFSVLPVMLTHGYDTLVEAHERSANISSVQGDDVVNHQFMKTMAFHEAQIRYIRRALVANIDIFSITQQIYDTLIFNGLHLLAPKEVMVTSSCNQTKPWCKRCAKCCYVWLGFQAHIGAQSDDLREMIDSVFGENLLDAGENLEWFSQLLGRREHNAMECVGGIPECQLMMEILYRRGWRGRAMDVYLEEPLSPRRAAAIATHYTSIDARDGHLPPVLRGPLRKIFLDIERHARDAIQNHGIDMKLDTAVTLGCTAKL